MIPLHRIWIACMGTLMAFLFVTARLGYLQIYQHAALSKRANREHAARYGETPRGAILDRFGNVMAMTLGGGSCFADPKRVKNPAATARTLAPLLDMSVAEVEAKLTQKKRFVWLARRLDPERALQVKGRSFPGIRVVTESKRFYPEESLAAHVLGVVGADHNGASGVEQAADEWLSGRSTPYAFSSLSFADDSQPLSARGETIPRSVVLTIDRSLQYIVEQELALQMQMSRAKHGAVVVQDPRTGDILAMASAPSFNPNFWGDPRAKAGYKVEMLKNMSVENVYEPGSTFKLVTAAAALDQQVVTPRDGFFCENGLWQIKGREIHDHEKDGWLTMTEVISHSSNIGTAKIAMKLGSDNLFRYARAFGFGSPTGCGLPGDGSGILRNPRVWTSGSLMTIAFGQEVGVTPLQMVNAYTVVANGGLLLEPRLFKGVVDEHGVYHEWESRKPIRRVVSAATVASMKRILTEVVEAGTGKAARVEGITVAGKTGTAQKIDAVTRRYHADSFLASFCGFAPANSPRLVIGVFLDDPRTSQWGGAEAAPLFSRIVRAAATYLRWERHEDTPLTIARSLPQN